MAAATMAKPMTIIEGDKNRIYVEGVNAPGALEGVILDYLWTHGEATVMQVYMHMREAVEGTSDKEKQYTTILNTFANLDKKGIITHEQASGTKRTLYVYRPAMSREEYAQSIIDKTMDVLMAYSPDAVANYVRAHRI
jgi:predicted transcriptional regulator